ncbi:MAG: uroporphyrinogen decarboxylase [Deltaproteobacteria bacterium]|nr:MAG: uroporphyrinogen decarboxylase [Deltaproteobacteria bacterium]
MVPAVPVENDSFLAACRGRTPARRPIWIMRQAGRYLPEYRAVRARVSFETLCRAPDLAAEVTVQPIERFDLDAAILFSDILTILDAFGIDVRFDPGPKIARPVRTPADVAALPEADLSACAYVYDAVGACVERLAGRVPLIGFAGAPLTVASYMIEGQGSRDFRHTKVLGWRDPEAFQHLLAQVARATAGYLERQVAAGAHALQVFESWGGALPPDVYRRIAWPHTRSVLEAALATGVPVVAFLRGGEGLLRAVAGDLPQGDLVIGIDWTVPMATAVSIVGPERVVQGNLDPMALFAPRGVLERLAGDVIAAAGPARGHVFNLGHGISKDTDPAQVAALVDYVHRS